MTNTESGNITPLVFGNGNLIRLSYFSLFALSYFSDFSSIFLIISVSVAVVFCINLIMFVRSNLL